MKHAISFVSGGLILSMFLLACSPAAEIPTLTAYTPSPDSTAIAASLTPETSVPVTGPAPTAIIIQHKAVPKELPGQRVNHAGDYDSSITAGERRAPGGDRFILGQYERPFNAGTMDVYFPDLDIQEVSIFQDDFWVFSAIRLKGRDLNDSFSGTYALELDRDLDGTGDLLVLVNQPSTLEWTSIGVQVWGDENNNVGGKLVIKADASGAGDGYETPIFDQGQGHNADLAWVRISPEDPNTIQIAFMKLLLTGDRAYMIGMWAGYDDLRPDLFDLNDHFTQSEAGEAMVELGQFYPIEEVSGLDNTCRMAIGFSPSGDEPGLC